jgi:type II secretion system protein D
MSRVSLRTLLTTGLLFAFRLSAQVPLPNTPPAVPAPAVAPAVTPPVLPPGMQPAGPVPALPPQNQPAIPGGEQTVRLQMLDASITDILELYSRLTARRLIYNQQISGPIRIAISDLVPQSEAIKIIEMTLIMNGFNIVPTEEPKIWKVTAAGQNPKSVGIPFVDREELLPPGEQTVMFLFKLQYADPTELAGTIGSGILAGTQGGATSITALPRAQALLVTENTSIIRTLIRIVRAIDVEPSEVVSEFISLQHGQAEEIAGYLEKLFEKQQAQPTAGMPGVAAQPRVTRQPTDASGAPLPPGVTAGDGGVSIHINGGATGTGPTEDNFVVGKVRITADKRRNSLHVVSRPVNMKLIRALVKEYDSQVPLAPPAVRPLRFRPVEEVMDAVVAAVKDPGEKDSGTGTSAPAAGARPQNQQANTTRGGAAGNTLGSAANNALGGSGGSSTIGNETLSTSERDTQPATQQVGKSTIIADKRANSIIVVGPKDTTEKIFALLDKLDVPQAQVMIHCIIGELKLSKNEEFGIEYILHNGGILKNATGGTTTGTGGATGTTTNNSVLGFDSAGRSFLNLSNLTTQTAINRALAGGAGGVAGVIASGTLFDVALKALENSDRFRVITRPSIFTSNNKRALITSGEEVPVPTNIQSQFNNATAGNTNNLVSNSSIQFKPIELRLEVLPLINSDKDVSLEIVQNISERSGTTRIDNNDIPNISRRAVKTYVTVPNGGTLILGGLIKESMDYTKSGIPKLVNLPLIGPLFGRHAKAKVRNELIIIMRPVVTLAADENAKLREKTFDAFNIPSDLEAAIMPQNIRERVKPPVKPATMRGSAPQFRAEPAVNSVRKR